MKRRGFFTAIAGAPIVAKAVQAEAEAKPPKQPKEWICARPDVEVTIHSIGGWKKRLRTPTV